MIKFLDISHKIWDKEEKNVCEFAWFDTVASKILTFNGENVWSSWEDFEYDFNKENDLVFNNIKRFKNLFPTII